VYKRQLFSWAMAGEMRHAMNRVNAKSQGCKRVGFNMKIQP
jgi:hypothetical protein